MKRKIVDRIHATASVDSTGVKLYRLLGHDAVYQYNPLLLLDVVDSDDPRDYKEGFPKHPHRGIETITYMLSGELLYRDAAGIQGHLKQGGLQWITAGSGLLHEEIPLETERMLVIQLWLNLPRKDKLTRPRYRTLDAEQLPVVNFRGGKLKVLAGEYQREKGMQGEFIPLTFYHLFLRKGEKLTLTSSPEEIVVMAMLRGNMKLSGEEVDEKMLLLFGQGDEVDMEALYGNAQALYIAVPRLHEPVAWGGPIIMNTESDLLRAFEDLRNNDFVKAAPIEDKK